jgi:AcrR family transcriptional regulator
VGRAELAEQVRQEVLSAALTEFLANGYHGATLDRIVASAGYTKGVVYSRFASKADLFLALLEERIARRAEQNRQLADGLHGVEGIVELIERWTEVQYRDLPWTLLVVEFRVHAARQPELLARYAALHERTLAGVAEVFALVLDGDPTTAPANRHVAQVLFAASNGVGLEQAIDAGVVSSEDLRRLVHALVDGVTDR